MKRVDLEMAAESVLRLRFGGDQGKGEAVYRDVRYMTPNDVADCFLSAGQRPAHVNVDEIVVRPPQQPSRVRQER